MKSRPRIEAFKVQRPSFDLAPSPVNRQWMDDFTDRHPYRCLPLSIANTHGWDILCPADVEISWNGNPGKADLVVNAAGPLPDGVGLHDFLRSHFTRGVFTFHTTYMFRTPPGWSLLVSGPYNHPKHGAAPLTGVVESDWLPYPFTMNWIMTAPGKVRFAKGEPVCTIMPIPKNYLGNWDVVIHEMRDDPAMDQQHEAFRRERASFQERIDARDPEAIKQAWQRHYFVGRHPDGTMVEDHVNKVRLAVPIDASGTRPAYAKAVPASMEPAGSLLRVTFRMDDAKRTSLINGNPIAAAMMAQKEKATVPPSGPWQPGSLLEGMETSQTNQNRAGRKRLSGGLFLDRQGVADLSKGIGKRKLDFLVVPDFLPTAQCSALTDYARGKDFDKHDASIAIDYWKNRILFYADIQEDAPGLAAMMRQAHGRAAAAIAAYYRLTDPIYADTVQLVRWSEGMHMEPHADRANPDGSKHAFAHRDFASVIYLNDDYEGGEIYFTAQDLLLKPRAGTLVAFTGGWRHEHAVTRVTRGTRYSMPGFYTFDASRRDRSFYGNDDQTPLVTP